MCYFCPALLHKEAKERDNRKTSPQSLCAGKALDLPETVGPFLTLTQFKHKFLHFCMLP